MNDEDARGLFSVLPDFNVHFRCRNSLGGGVTLLVRDSIVFEPLAVSSLPGFEALPSDSKRELAELELVALRLLSGLKDLVVVSYYNPPPTNQSKNKNKKREL